MATIKEIAKKSGVSPGTVSNVLNGKRPVANSTRDKVLKVIREMHYQPDYFAQGLRKRKSNLIGIIAEEIVQFTTPAIVEGVMSFCEKEGYKIILENLRLYSRWGINRKETEESFWTYQSSAFLRMGGLNVDGIIYIGAHMHEVKNIPSDLTVPLVLAYGYDQENRFSTVILDDERSGYDMTKYLISMGHRQIGIVGGLEDNEHAKRRIRGYQRALYENGIPYNPSWVVYGGWMIEDGYQGIRTLLQENVSAVFCLSDAIAGGVYKYLNERNLVVGKDLSVVGFDNREMTDCFCPPLTTMRMPCGDIGEEAAKILLDQINEKNDLAVPKNRQLICRLVKRQSVVKIN